MSEMLGNRYFMARQFALALPHLQTAVEKAPGNARARQKLVVCYLAADMLNAALSHFIRLFDQAPTLALMADPDMEICPCRELLASFSQTMAGRQRTARDYLTLGLLRASSDLPQAIDDLQRARDMTGEFTTLSDLIGRLENWHVHHPAAQEHE